MKEVAQVYDTGDSSGRFHILIKVVSEDDTGNKY